MFEYRFLVANGCIFVWADSYDSAVAKLPKGQKVSGYVRVPLEV